MKVEAIKTKIFEPLDDIYKFIDDYLPKIDEKSVLVITSKIVSLAEGRFVKKFGEKEKEEIIRQESDFCIESKYALLTLKDGVVMANAGVDESNAGDNIILLPKDSFFVAEKIRKYLLKKHKIKKLGVIITDSRSMPLRRGITGVSLGYSGICGLKNYKNKIDLFGRPFKFSMVNVVDSLAVSAVLCMGEGNESFPLAIIADAPVRFCDKIDKDELRVDVEHDIYAPIYSAISKK